MKIQKAREKDASRIRNLKDKSLKKIVSKNYTKKQIEILIEKNSKKRIEDKTMFLLTKNKRLIGIVHIDLKEKIVGSLYINPKYIKKGLGKKLLVHAEKYAKKNKIKKIKLYSTKTALNFYKNQNYKIIGRKIWTPKKGVSFPIIIMEKEITK